MSMRQTLLSDSQWTKIEPLLPKAKRKRSRRGRPRKDNRSVFLGILWVLRTGARWRDVPKEFGVSGSTCWKRLVQWEEQGIWLRLWRAFLSELDEQAALDWNECFMDGSFAPAKKGAPELAKPSVARAQSGWWWSTARVFLWEAKLPRHRPPK
jgi:transposase